MLQGKVAHQWAIASVVGISTLIGLAVPARADWVFVGENADGDRFHVEEDTVVELIDGVVVFDTLIDYKLPRQDGIDVAIDRFVADCQSGNVINVSWTMLDANDRIVDASALPTLETNVAPPGTLIESEITFACETIRR